MLIDALGLVSDAQALAASGLATNVIDLGNVTPRRAIGDGEPMGFAVSVDVAADHTTGDETYEIDLVSDEDSALGSPTVIAKYVIAAADLKAGALHFLAVPPGTPTERYLGLSYVLGGTTPSVTLTAWLTAQALFAKLAATYARNYAV